MDSNLDELKETLDNLSGRKHVISDEAVYAKQFLDEQQALSNQTLLDQFSKQQSLVGEFNTSIQLLMQIFKQSKFDSVLGLAVNPSRMLLLNFCIGIFRGLGFCVGMLLFLGLFFYFFGHVFLTLL